MSLATLTEIRSYLKTHAALSAWFAAHYPDKTVRHFIGYKKPANANDYPAICYVPVRERIGEQPFDRLSVSLVVSLNEKGMADHVLDGVNHSDQAVQLIVAALRSCTSPFNIENDVLTVTTDLGINHPYYDTEIQFTVLTLR